MTISRTSSPSAIFQQYSSDVYRWAYRLLGRHHDAQDVAQDVCVKWLQATRDDAAARTSAMGTLAPSAPENVKNPRAWLRRITINRAIDVMRARTSAMALAAEPELSLRIAGDLERAELRQEITLALETLTESQRSVLIAKVFDALTFAQIAAEHNLAVPTVKTHYLRAVKALRDRLRKLDLLEWKDS